MVFDNKIWMGKSGDEKVFLLPQMSNRHGLIAGATGTGKTITLKVMAEAFSEIGVPVFLSDVKGDLAGMCQPGIDNESMQKRITKFGIDDFKYKSFPTCFWDLYGKKGHPMRTTISEMGPTLLARILGLNDTQEGVLYITFRVADDNGWLLLDIKDLRSMLQFVSDNASKYTIKYGNISKQSIGAISRALLTLEDNGGDFFIGEPSLDINDWIKCDSDGRGYINILDSTTVINNPKLYSTFMLWMLTDLYEKMPEMGDISKPKMVFFFDEAHLLFNNIPKALLEKVEQIVKLIRSKGIGIFFITQNPADIPDSVLAQLGNKVQHALRAYTPSEQRAIKVAADSFRADPNFSTEKVISEMGIGEALVSFLDEKGKPNIVKRTFILPPESRMGTIDDTERANVIRTSSLGSKYDTSIDRESAYEILSRKYETLENEKEKAEKEKQEEKERKEAEKLRAQQEKEAARIAREQQKARAQDPLTKILNSATRTATSTVTRTVVNKLARGILGTLLGGRK